MYAYRKWCWLVLSCAALATAPLCMAQMPQGTAFTYQGDLNQNGAPVNADVDMAFALFDASSSGNPVGSELDFTSAQGNPVDVQDGIFTVALDFGALAFSGAVSDQRFLQVTINGIALSPRTKIENAPYALQARTAELAYSVSNASIGTAQIIPAQVQQRVSGNCAVGSSIRSIAQDGTVTCQAGGNGTVTSVNSGTGLTGGPIIGSGTLGIANAGVGLAQIDSTQVQARVSGSCGSGQKVLAINADGTVTCATDAIGGTGTVTSINSGTGLTGGPVTATGTLSIANGGVGLAQINSSQVQARIGGVCTLGEYVRGINADGTVICSPLLTPRISAIDSSGKVGGGTSIVIGVDGLAIVSYHDSIDGDLKVAHCMNPTCTSATITSVDTVGNVGQYTSITIGADQLPIVSYYDLTNGHLKVAHCNNAACTGGATLTTVDTAASVGLHNSIAIGADDFPIVSYYDQANDHLKVAHCDNIDCTIVGTLTTVDPASGTGAYTSIAIGADRLPIISYFDDSSNGALKVVHCANAACVGASTITSLDAAFAGEYSSITIGVDSLPVIAYFSPGVGMGSLRVAHCANTACTSATLTTVDKSANVGSYTSIATGAADGFPIISYLDLTNGDLKVAHCSNAACTGSATVTAEDTAGTVGFSTSITIGSDGLPIMSYTDGTNGYLKVLKCNNRFCE